MTPTPDKLFRDRLEPLKTTPPTAAWDRIAAGVNKRNTRWRGFVIGAIAFLMIGLAGAFFITTRNSIPAHAPKQEIPETPTLEMAQAPTAETQLDVVVMDSQSTATVAESATQLPRHSVVTTKRTISIETPRHTQVENPDQSIDEQVMSQSTAAVVEPSSVATVDLSPEKQTNHKITYTAADVNARFKRKPKATVIDTSNKAPSALQRVLDVAYEFKYENTMLGDLRQMKDELFTSNGNGPARDK